MRKSKSGILLRYIAAFSFLLIFFDQFLLSAALIAVALYIEKDEWLSRQTIQAFLLGIISDFILNLAGGTALLSSFSNFTYDPYYSSIFDYISFFDVFKLILVCGIAIATLVFTIIAIVRTLKEQDANIPLLSTISYRMFGLIKPMQQPQQYTSYSPNYYYPPNQPTNAQSNPQQSTPPQTAPNPQSISEATTTDNQDS